MFTGIVQDVGTIESVEFREGDLVARIKTGAVSYTHLTLPTKA